MLNFKLGHEMGKIQCSVCHEQTCDEVTRKRLEVLSSLSLLTIVTYKMGNVHHVRSVAKKKL